MVIQSAGTGLTLFSGSFLVVLAVAAAGEAPGAGVEEAVLVAGFCAQPAVTKARTLASNRNFFIDPPEQNMYLRLSAMELIRAVWIGRKLTRPIVVVYRI